MAKKLIDKLKKGKFGKDVRDIILILPTKEGTINGSPMTTMRIPISGATNIEWMSAVLRQMWLTVCKEDKQLGDEFKTYFENQEKEKKRLEKMMQRNSIKADTEKSKKIGKKLNEIKKA